jgi:hypothetical protein
MMRSRSLQGGHPNTIVVADDVRIVEHRGNPGRPHAATEPSRTLIQGASSSLRCKTNTLSNTKPNTTNPNPRAPNQVLDTHTSTGNHCSASRTSTRRQKVFSVLACLEAVREREHGAGHLPHAVVALTEAVRIAKVPRDDGVFVEPFEL